MATINIEFPGLGCQRMLNREASIIYYRTHYEHVKNYLSYIGKVNVTDNDTTIDGSHDNNFIVDIAGRPVMFDYSDHHHTVDLSVLPENIKYFKFHTTANSNKRCTPFPPMSFIDWNLYYDLVDKISYNPFGDIFYKCTAYGDATKRRIFVGNLLQEYGKLKVDTEYVEQRDYFTSLANCRINVIVPGARIDILDRTHLQSFAFGIPVISPYISTLLPFGEMFEPNVDYIECLPDFSNLIELIEKYKDDQDYLNYISKNCKQKFAKTCTPANVVPWLLTP